MSLFSLDWFKSERDKELELLKIEEQRLRNQLLQKMLDTPDLFKNSSNREASHNIKAISTSGNITIHIDPEENVTDSEKSVTIDEQLPRTIPPQDVELLKEITEERPSVTIDESRPYDYLYTDQENRTGSLGIRYTDEPISEDVVLLDAELSPEQEVKLKELVELAEIVEKELRPEIVIELISEEAVQEFKEKLQKFVESEKVIEKTPPPPATIYKTAKLINNVINVILRDGTILTKVGVDREFFEKVKAAETEQAIRDLFIPQEQIREKKADDVKKEKVKKEIEQVKAILKGVDLLKDCPDFKVIDDAVYLKGIDRSIPKVLLEKFISLFAKYEGLNVTITDEFLALKKFWLKCCLNPNAQSAEDLYLFLSKHQFKIDKHGNFYAYRRVVSQNTSKDKDLVDFISNTHNKVKAVWKKKPAIFDVYSRLGEYRLVTDEKIPKEDNPFWIKVGNLKDLYENLPNMKENSYTDAQTHSYSYKVGEVISMPRNEGDDNNTVSCSKGFHQASKEYDYSGFGDTPILSIVNPMDVLAVPEGEVGKLRVCRWFFAMTLPEKEKYILDDDAFDVSDLGDIFEEKCMSNIEEHVATSYAEEVKRHTFNVPKLFTESASSIISCLGEINTVLSKRVSIIK